MWWVAGVHRHSHAYKRQNLGNYFEAFYFVQWIELLSVQMVVLSLRYQGLLKWQQIAMTKCFRLEHLIHHCGQVDSVKPQSMICLGGAGSGTGSNCRTTVLLSNHCPSGGTNISRLNFRGTTCHTYQHSFQVTYE